MLRVDVSDAGIAESLLRLAASIDDAPPGVAFHVAEDVAFRAVIAITTGTRTGRFYRDGDGFHRASAPGEPPANWTGRLASSFSAEPGVDDASAEIVSDVNYALYLEQGSIRLEPRPYLDPAFAAAIARLDGEVLDQAFSSWIGDDGP